MGPHGSCDKLTALHWKRAGETEYPLPASLIAKSVKNPPAMQETPVRFLGREDPLEKGIDYPLQYSWASLVSHLVKNTPAMRETWI